MEKSLESIVKEVATRIAQVDNTILKESPQQTLMIIGRPKSGKSILTAYINGNTLKIQGKGNRATIVIDNQQTIDKESKFHAIKLSNQDYQGVVYELRYDSTLVDQIVNRYILERYINGAKNPKILLNVDVRNVVTDNPQEFVAIMKDMDGLLGQYKQLHKAFICVVSKVEEDYTTEDIQYDIENIQKQIVNTEFKKYILHYLNTNHKHFIFKKLNEKTVTDRQDAKKFVEAIQKISVEKKKGFNYQVGLSSNFQIYTTELRQNAQNTFADIVKGLESEFDFSQIQSIDQLQEKKRELKSLQQQAEQIQANSLFEYLNGCYQILTHFKSNMQQEFVKLLEQAKLIEQLRRLTNANIYNLGFYSQWIEKLFKNIGEKLKFKENQNNVQQLNKTTALLKLKQKQQAERQQSLRRQLQQKQQQHRRMEINNQNAIKAQRYKQQILQREVQRTRIQKQKRSKNNIKTTQLQRNYQAVVNNANRIQQIQSNKQKFNPNQQAELKYLRQEVQRLRKIIQNMQPREQEVGFFKSIKRFFLNLF